MRRVCVCFCLALLLPWCVQSQRRSPALAKLDDSTQKDLLAVDIPNRSGVLNSLLHPEHHMVLRGARAPRPASQVPKRAQQGSRFALSLDVPTSILSVLIDLAKNQDMRTKAAANAELMARIGRRK
uniref:Corticotropin-releasing factor domain-containing protein n=1 Tax=Echeneis naucrates TaxID=173247 RepID=A0A665VCV0_ECHNA